MKEVIAILRPGKWQSSRDAVAALGVEESSQHRVIGRGKEGGLHYLRQGGGKARMAGMPYLPKRMLTWLVPDELGEKVVETLIRINQTGNFGDGKVFVSPVYLMEGLAAPQESDMALAAHH